MPEVPNVGFKTVLMDSWYATQRLIALIDIVILIYIDTSISSYNWRFSRKSFPFLFKMTITSNLIYLGLSYFQPEQRISLMPIGFETIFTVKNLKVPLTTKYRKPG